MRGRGPTGQPRPTAPGGRLEGLRFVGRTQILLGAILLDLLAVLFGGAVALLPIFARSILHVGPPGSGSCAPRPRSARCSPASSSPAARSGGRAGRTLLIVVGLFGASMVVFGLSRVFLLSLIALAVSGFVDLYSMNIRSTTVALATPDRLRGRVNAIEIVFISASNQLGAFESGVAAFLFGTVPAVVGGGVITMVIAFGWRRIFPPWPPWTASSTLRPAVSAHRPVQGDQAAVPEKSYSRARRSRRAPGTRACSRASWRRSVPVRRGTSCRIPSTPCPVKRAWVSRSLAASTSGRTSSAAKPPSRRCSSAWRM